MVSTRWDLTIKLEGEITGLSAPPEKSQEEIVDRIISWSEDNSFLIWEGYGDTLPMGWMPLSWISLNKVEKIEELRNIITWKRLIVHDERWIKIRSSFYGSREWKEFRRAWLEKHPACVQCSRTDGILQVHHTGFNTLDMTVLDEGFLEGLHHPERFETICYDEHQEKHSHLIEAERRILGKSG